MPRVKGRAYTCPQSVNVFLKRAKGFVSGPGVMYRQAIEFTRRAGAYATRDRRKRSGTSANLWVVRLSAALSAAGGISTTLHPRPRRRRD